MPARDSNASFLFLMVLMTGVALAAPSEAATVRLLTARGLGSSNALYEASESWRTSVRFYAAAQ